MHYYSRCAQTKRWKKVKTRTDASVLDGCLRRIAGGDRGALTELYEQTRSAVYAFSLSIVRSHEAAEDILQDVYIRIWDSADQYSSAGKPLAWILAVTRNEARQYLRQHSRTVALPAEDLQARMEAQPPGAAPEDRMVLSALLDALSDEERQIVTLHAVAGLKHRELSKLLSLPLSTVISKYHRALKKLKNQLEEDAT